MSRKMDESALATCLESLEAVPRMPSYATRALDRLKGEVLRARREEQRLREAMDDVKRAVQDVET
jgi:hypothetical protein